MFRTIIYYLVEYTEIYVKYCAEYGTSTGYCHNLILSLVRGENDNYAGFSLTPEKLEKNI